MATDIYNRTSSGAQPVSVVQFKDYIRLPQSMVTGDATIQTMLAASVEWGEKYTRREFRDNTWTLTMDKFPTSFRIRRDPVVTITSITYKLAGVVTTVPAERYYLVKDVQTSHIFLNDTFSWPTDGDEATAGLLQSIVVTFDTEPYSFDGQISLAVMQHTANLYSERGDCTISDAAKNSGALDTYNQFRVARI